MTDPEIDEILTRLARNPRPGEPAGAAVLDRVAGAILPDLRPVRPLPPAWLLAAAIWLAGLAVAMGGAFILGMQGIQKLSGMESALIFMALGLSGWLAAAQSAAGMVPASRRIADPPLLMAVVSVVLLAVFAILFSGYDMQGFAKQGVPCLRAGLIHAVPAGAAAWLVLRRGFFVDSAAVGWAAGTLAGLTGVVMLELHCANQLAVHVMTWHVAVIPVSAAAGALLARRKATPWGQTAGPPN